MFRVSQVLVCLCVCVLHTGLGHRTLLSLHGLTRDADDNNVTLTFGKTSVRIPRSIYAETTGPVYHDLWQEILFPENESLHTVELVNKQRDDEVVGPHCIYVPDYPSDDSQNETTINFHCARGQSQPCLNSGLCDNKDCRRPGGVCNCSNTAGFEGVNCGIKTANIDGSGCPLGCIHGVCVSDGRTAHCECHPGFAGHLCDKKAYYHDCFSNGFHVCITPFSVETFSGDIYIKGHKSVAGCSLKKAPNPPVPDDGVPDWCIGYVASIDYNSSCGVLRPVSDGSMTSYELELTVQYAKQIITCTDEKVTLICQYNRHSLIMYRSVLLEIGGQQYFPTRRETEHVSPVVLTLRATNGSHLYPPLPIGYKVDVCISASGVTGFHGITINTMVMNNTRAGDDYKEIALYDGGCVSDSLSSVVSKTAHWPTPGDKSKICLQFKIFFFDRDQNLTYPALGLVADVSVFTDAGDAIMPTCGSRQRRQAKREERKTVVGTTISIIIPQPMTDLPMVSDNSIRLWFMPVGITVGVVAVLSAVVLVAFVVKCGRAQMKVDVSP